MAEGVKAEVINGERRWEGGSGAPEKCSSRQRAGHLKVLVQIQGTSCY